MELAQSPELKQIQYTVQKGDNLSNIAKKVWCNSRKLESLEWSL
jgi:nucleoid-associated protein YgaU